MFKCVCFMVCIVCSAVCVCVCVCVCLADNRLQENEGSDEGKVLERGVCVCV